MHDPGFDWDTIAKNKGELVTGRNLQERALTAIANYKFALKFAKEFLDSRQNTPSGCKLPDLLAYVRKKMFIEFRGCRNKPTATQGKKVVSEEDMPPKYIFNGYMAFVLFGPQGIAEQTLTCLSEDGKKTAKKGRAAARAQESEIKNREREAGTGGYVPEQFRRGVSLQSKAQSAFLAHSEHNAALKNYRELLQIANQDQANNMRELDYIGMQMEGTVNPVDYHQLEFWKDDILSRLRQNRQNKRKYEDEIAKLTENGPQTQAYYDQVGDFKRKSTSGGKKSAPGNDNSKKKKLSGDDAMSQLTESTHEFTGPLTVEDDGAAVVDTAYVYTQYSTESQNDAASAVTKSTGV